MLTPKQISDAEEVPERGCVTDQPQHGAETPNRERAAAGLRDTAALRHDDIATQLLRGMFNDNLRLATRMMDIGDCSSAERLLQSAITQVRQIASYDQPKTTKTETTIDV